MAVLVLVTEGLGVVTRSRCCSNRGWLHYN